MTLQELKALFLEEHKRDKKYTIINFILILVVASIIIGFLFYIGTNFMGIFHGLYSDEGTNGGDMSWFPKVILPIVVLCMIGYPFFKLWKLTKRPNEIDELLKSIEAGAKASSVADAVDYKIIVPLGKTTIKFVPINFAVILVGTKAYQLPVRKVYMADIKLLLSGANMEKLNEIRNALYGDDDSEATENYIASKVAGVDGETVVSKPQEVVMTPIKPVEEFKTFLNEELKETLEGMETTRKSTFKMIVFWAALILVVMGGLGYYFYSSTSAAHAEGDYSGGSSYKFIIGFFVVARLGSYFYSMKMRSKYKATAGSGIGMESAVEGAAGGDEFKQKVFKRMIDFVNPTVEYAPIGHIGLPEFLESGLFVSKSYDINGSDQIMGRHNGVPFIMCDLQVYYQKNFSNEKDGPDEVFCGQYFVARFNKKFSSPVFIKAKTGLKGVWTDNSIRSYMTSDGSKVTLEDPEFMKMFEVYSNDQIEARYILTPSLMERIKELAKRTKGEYYIAFTNNKISIANNSRTDNFEMGSGFTKSYTKNDNEIIVNFYKDLTDQFALVDDLRLNVKIWG